MDSLILTVNYACSLISLDCKAASTMPFFTTFISFNFLMCKDEMKGGSGDPSFALEVDVMPGHSPITDGVRGGVVGHLAMQPFPCQCSPCHSSSAFSFHPLLGLSHAPGPSSFLKFFNGFVTLTHSLCWCPSVFRYSLPVHLSKSILSMTT